MYFEVFLEIIISLLAFFGVYCIVKLIGVSWFGYDNIMVTVEVDSPDTANNIEEYIKEAETSCLAVGGREIAVIVQAEFYDEKLMGKLKDRKIRYYVIDKK